MSGDTVDGLANRRILVVEDEVLIAMQIEEILLDLGCVVVGAVGRHPVHAGQRLQQLGPARTAPRPAPADEAVPPPRPGERRPLALQAALSRHPAPAVPGWAGGEAVMNPARRLPGSAVRSR